MSDIITSTNRQPVEWIELDMPKCSRAYGASPCMAQIGTTGDGKCFNTRATCQDPSNYSGSETLTYNFIHNRGLVPDDKPYLPYLQSATVSPAKINPGGGNKNMSALGIRSTLSVSLSDHPYSDLITDPYLTDRLGISGYNPYTVSSFWPKWRARNPYYTHRVVRHKSGYIDPNTLVPDASTLTTRTFFVTSLSGFTSGGSVSLQAKDIFTLCANDKAKAPAVSTGRLASSVTDTDTVITLTPAGIGNSSYPSSGKVRVNKEVMSFTRASDVLTITRSQNNTDASAHSENDTVQLCLIYTSQSPKDILYDLLTTYSGIDPAYLDYAQWSAETTDYLPRLYSTIITEPTGVTTLISEMCEQMYFTTFWNDKEALLKLRAVRPSEGEAITALNDEQHLLENSITWSDLQDELITQVWVYYAQRNPTEKIDETANYGAIEVVIDPDSEGQDKNNTQKIKTVYSRWMTTTDGAAAIDLGQKILARYNNIPRQCSFSLDAKDGVNLGLADFITAQNRSVVDFIGRQLPVSMQITSSQEAISGTTYKYTAIEYTGESIEANPDEMGIVIPDNVLNVNLRDLFDEKYGITPSSGDKVRITIRNGTTIGGASRVTGTGTGTDLFTAVSPVYAGLIKDYGESIVNRTVDNLCWIQRRGISTENEYLIGQAYNDSYGSVSGLASSEIKESPLSVALDTGTWPAGVELFLDIEGGGAIIGEGGNTSIAYLGSSGDQNPVRGGDGGHAMNLTHPITINNLGVIASGGGGGSMYIFRKEFPSLGSLHQTRSVYFAGGGGAGSSNSYAGSSADTWTVTGGTPPYTINEYISSSGGTSEDNGIGATALVFPNLNNAVNRSAGNGGGLASSGLASESNTRVGVPGDAILTGSSLVTWVTKGDVRGAENT